MKKLYVAFIILLSWSKGYTQDIHFSQYYASPLTLNPALTANINGEFRAAASYRSQWFMIPTLNASAPYQTYQASFDMPILRDRLGNDAFGFGGVFYGDAAGDGALATYSGLASIAYHKAVDRYGRARLSLGMQAGVVSQQINFANLVFEKQLDSYGFNTSLPNGENTSGYHVVIYPDVNVGALWSHAASDKVRYYLGFSMDHLSRPRVTFLGNDANRLNYRYNVHGGAEFFLNRENTLTLAPTFLIMLQGNVHEYNAGLGLNYELNDNYSIFGAGMYRVSDAVIVTGGLEAYNVRLGLSYDINYSSLETSSHAQGAVEISLVYVHKKQKAGKVQYDRYCPTF